LGRIGAIWGIVYVIVSLALTASVSAQQGSYLDEHPTKRLALVIGNSNYLHQRPIPSSAVDAHQVAETLRKMKFDAVEEVHEIKSGVEFWNLHFLPFISKIKENDFAVLYFSGHGLSYGGENFILMLEAPETIPESEALKYLIPLSSMRQFFSGQKPGVSLFLLDACRTISGGIKKDNGAIEAISKGMVQIPPTPDNVVIGFSSDFGTVSQGRDEDGKMSYYTDALLKFVPNQDNELQYIKKQTRLDVIYKTHAHQIPWFSESESAEIYLEPSQKILDGEKTAWLSRLATNDVEQIWKYTIEYAVSRYVAAAKRWVADFDNRQTQTTKISPESLNAAWSDDPNKPISVRRIDGPFAFKQIATLASNNTIRETSSAEGDEVTAGDTAELLASHGRIVVTRAITARTLPDEESPASTTIESGTVIKIANVTTDTQGGSWLQINTNGTNAYLPAARAAVGQTHIGYSLKEIWVPPADGLQSLVNTRPILDALVELRADKRIVSRISISAPSSADKQLRAKLAGRLAHAVFVLEQAGVSRTVISAGTDTLPGENIRIRFFGN
jgi:hypothetical protein